MYQRYYIKIQHEKPIFQTSTERSAWNLSHLREHKFNYNFSDTLVSLCSCGVLEAETTDRIQVDSNCL